MMERECFIPGCTQSAASSNLTFHRLPSSTNLLRRLLLLLFEDLDPSEFPVIKSDSAMCSAHFNLLMCDTDLVHVLVNSMITKKPSQEAISVAPKCAAFCCCINLYSDVSLFMFPSDDERFTLWRRVAGWPKERDCNYLCARHFKRSSFVDVDRRKLVKPANPLYPTRPYNTKYQNYCPLKKPLPVPQPLPTLLDDPEDDGAAKPKIASRKKWRCAAKGCDVSYLSHPDMRKINFPSDPERLNLWREVVGYVPNVKYNTSLCTRHFALSQFYDEETRKNFVKLANPVYPTGRLNLNTNDYCPPELDITVHMEKEEGNVDFDSLAANDSVITVVEGSRTSEIILVTEDIKRCSAASCPVNSKTHPNVKLHDFPETNMRKMLVWLKIAGCPTQKPRQLCERHFDHNSRDLIPKYPFGDLDPETHTYKPVFNPIDPKCCVHDCNVSPGDSDTIYHRFPLEKEIFESWIHQIGCRKLALYDHGNVFRGFRVCSRHFTPSSYCKQSDDVQGGIEMVLKPTAIPTCHLGVDDCRCVVSEEVGAEMEVQFQDIENTDYLPSSPAEEDESGYRYFANMVKRELAEKRKSENVMVPPDRKRVKVEFVGDGYKPVSYYSVSSHVGRNQDVIGSDPFERGAGDTEDRGLPDGCETVTITTSREAHAEENGRESEDEVMSDTARFDEDDASSLSDAPVENDTQPTYDIINIAVRMCKIDSRKTKRLKNLSGKQKIALNVLGNILSRGLMELVNSFGLRFLTNCFSRILDFPLLVADNDNVVSDCEMNDEEKEELHDELMKFSTILLTVSRKLYNAIAHVASLPSSSRARNWLICGNGVPGMSRKGFARLKEKCQQAGSKTFLISLAVVEFPLRREVSWTGKEVFGFVDLGHGRITDVSMEATAVLMFYANSPTHDFQTPLGYCLINSLSPAVRANLICLYLLQIHSIGVRCNSVVCEDSSVTHQTYRELGIVCDNGLPVRGYFQHPGQGADNVFCFVDVGDAFRSISTLLAETTVFLSYESNDIRWSDVETVHKLPQWDLLELPINVSRFRHLRSLQLKLKKDNGVFKKNSSLVLKAIKRHNNSKSGTGTSEFLAKMDAIDNLFSGCNSFCKEAPAVHSQNITLTLGRIRNALIYLSALKDPSGCNLLQGSRMKCLGLALNLVSLKGYLKRLFSERRQKENITVKTQSLTLREVRSGVRGLPVEMATAKEFRTAFKSILKDSFRKPYSKCENPSDVSPLHIGLNVTESYQYEPLNTRCEHAEEYLMKNVVCRWFDETSCPDCCFLMSMEAASCVGPGLSSNVRKLFQTAERCLRTAEEIPLDGERFPRFVCSVLHEMADFSGFLSASHLFDSVEFGRTSHFTMLVNSLLRIFLRYRIGFMSTTTKVTIRPESRQTNYQRSAFSV